ncbi:MAG: hypothetical protein CVU42_01590 [Chloroflexi bacterium HGW-Chloroflexi-4]|nr:MAG: hypothetical protein CVU42_01590 [Chloroflexi bacterium HGW-Chloroflexi-4]
MKRLHLQISLLWWKKLPLNHHQKLKLQKLNLRYKRLILSFLQKHLSKLQNQNPFFQMKTF